NELSQSLNQLRSNGASVLAIACNTLHAFLDETDKRDDLVHLPRTVAKEISKTEIPLVLCTSTSAQFALHQRFFPCVYPDLKTQKKVDDLIDLILKGLDKQIILKQLNTLIQMQSEKTVILGCTELSLFTSNLSVTDKLIIDPLEVMARKILEISFSNN
ncbi:MAG: aspartate/glutamate racemase family protein, partial [Parachlamydiaceae bacterium]|nr:aspartate/glutamate racemase family protein [Parachlamydiaceae bacterium]